MKMDSMRLHPRRRVSLVRDGWKMWWLARKVEYYNWRIKRLNIRKGVPLTAPRIMELSKELDQLVLKLGDMKGYFCDS